MQTSNLKVDIAIIAGGKSSRMGCDKRKLFLSDVIRKLDFADNVLLSVEKGNGERISKFCNVDSENRCGNTAIELVEDEIDFAGPIGGILSVLKACRQDAVFVTACDMPFFTVSQVRDMIETYDGSDVYVACVRDERAETGSNAAGKDKIEPLFAIYSKKCIPVFEKMIAEGNYKIRSAFSELCVRQYQIANADTVININTPDDYRKYYGFDVTDRGDEQKRLDELARKLINFAKDTIVINMRFMDVALSHLDFVSAPVLQGIACDGNKLYYNSLYLVKCYNESPNLVTRMIVHSLLHFVFRHDYNADKLDEELWNTACDIAIENMIIELDVNSFLLEEDSVRYAGLLGLRKNVKILTAERIYRHFKINGLSTKDKANYERMFKRDIHSYWRKAENYEISDKEWKKLSERIKTELGSFSKDGQTGESLMENLKEAARESYDYDSMLRRFCVTNEEVKISQDEFDYIYYTYGLTNYDNMPFVEPLEFAVTNSIRDFAIVIDTSASCKGSLIRSFLTKTYEILKESESFAGEVNIHIIQCDNDVRDDIKITCIEELDAFLSTGKLYGYGGTDYRPAFKYIDDLIEKREFNDLKGIIYFTDGYGIYPEVPPEYESMFVFVRRDVAVNDVPWWAIKVELWEEDIENEHSKG